LISGVDQLRALQARSLPVYDFEPNRLRDFGRAWLKRDGRTRARLEKAYSRLPDTATNSLVEDSDPSTMYDPQGKRDCSTTDENK